MALLGISILIASLTFIVYRSQVSVLSSIVKLLKRPPGSGQPSHGETGDSQKGAATENPNQDVISRDEKRQQMEEEVLKPKLSPPLVHAPPEKPTAVRDSVSYNTQSLRPNPAVTTTRQYPTPASKASSSSLMPPPPRPAPSALRRTPQTTSASLSVPTTGPLPNRLPPGRSSNTLSPSAAARQSSLPTPGTGRQKVVLTPGHSPLDWAALTRSGTNLAGVPQFQRVTPAELAHNNGRKGKPAWSLWRGKVYNVSPYLPFHPGGEGELMRGAGKDAEKMFMEAHSWVNWENMLGECLVGFLVESAEPGRESGSGLDEMD